MVHPRSSFGCAALSRPFGRLGVVIVGFVCSFDACSRDMPLLSSVQTNAVPTHVLLVMQGWLTPDTADNLAGLVDALRSSSQTPGKWLVCNASNTPLHGVSAGPDIRLYPGTPTGLLDAFSRAQSYAFEGSGRLLRITMTGSTDTEESLPLLTDTTILGVPAALADRVLHLSISPPGKVDEAARPGTVTISYIQGTPAPSQLQAVTKLMLEILRTGNVPDFLPQGRLDVNMLCEETCRQSAGWRSFATDSGHVPSAWLVAAVPSAKTTYLRQRIWSRIDNPVLRAADWASDLEVLKRQVDQLPLESLISVAGALDRFVLGTDTKGVEFSSLAATLLRQKPMPVRPTLPQSQAQMAMKNNSPAPPPVARAAPTSRPVQPTPVPLKPQQLSTEKPKASKSAFQGGTRRIAF
jgi:hypothetical protein